MSAALKLPPEPGKEALPNKKVFNTAKLVTYKPGGIGKRLIAIIIDSLITGVIVQLVTVFMINKLVPGVLNQSIAGIGFSMIFVPVFYWTYLTVQYGGTPGKKMMGLKIISADKKKLKFKQVLLRETFGRSLSTIVLGVGYLSALGDKKERRTWHDRMAKTRVVEYR